MKISVGSRLLLHHRNV